ncbi:GNAT family N-acetyltransferase [Leucobacter insecticola]|uniref:GNAT family N-acetyltransferase n=1 Tax=Leucobacter insecticola TaxID=2714934 RepID=A0A6G8FIS1_9MICO|nr:GNAT family N-acetyltransferase [Leucobacter insecticola]QIM16265.1 GNAT family N-acetyltransferase [Leucobacter insecticola]
MRVRIDDETTERWNARDRSLDSQLPERKFATVDGALIERNSGSAISAVGLPSRVALCADAPEALWGALQRDQLELRWDGDTTALNTLLDRWVERVEGDLGPEDEWETAMELVVPARDSAAAIPLLAHGFAVVGAIGIRVGRRGTDPSAAEARLKARGYTLRQASLADVSILAELDVELLAHDSQHGSVTIRPGAAAILADGIRERLEQDPEWTWLLERQGEVAGYLSIEFDRERHRAECSAAAGGEIQGGAGAAPVGYIQAMYLREEVRGAGIGESVVEFGHGRLEAAGVERVLLGYAAINPRSGPFWCRMGYRPLWNSWQRRPAT